MPFDYGEVGSNSRSGETGGINIAPDVHRHTVHLVVAAAAVIRGMEEAQGAIEDRNETVGSAAARRYRPCSLEGRLVAVGSLA